MYSVATLNVVINTHKKTASAVRTFIIWSVFCSAGWVTLTFSLLATINQEYTINMSVFKVNKNFNLQGRSTGRVNLSFPFFHLLGLLLLPSNLFRVLDASGIALLLSASCSLLLKSTSSCLKPIGGKAVVHRVPIKFLQCQASKDPPLAFLSNTMNTKLPFSWVYMAFFW